jgi:aspartate aminotransferase
LGKKGREKKIENACDFADYLLDEARVAAVPGEDFGSPENIRFTYANSLEEIEKGCERVAAAVKKLE